MIRLAMVTATLKDRLMIKLRASYPGLNATGNACNTSAGASVDVPQDNREALGSEGQQATKNLEA